LLDQARVGNQVSAYQKARNRIIFVRKHWNIFQKIIFFTIWLRGNSVRLLAKIFIYSKWQQKRKLISSFLKWIWDWLFKY
jgi:hypothetical protein